MRVKCDMKLLVWYAICIWMVCIYRMSFETWALFSFMSKCHGSFIFLSMFMWYGCFGRLRQRRQIFWSIIHQLIIVILTKAKYFLGKFYEIREFVIDLHIHVFVVKSCVYLTCTKNNPCVNQSIYGIFNLNWDQRETPWASAESK